MKSINVGTEKLHEVKKSKHAQQLAGGASELKRANKDTVNETWLMKPLNPTRQFC